MLTLDRVTYRYAGAARPALREISLTLRDGEVVGLVGANESGKSTLALVMSGLAPRSIGGTLDGRLILDGEDVRDQPIHELATRVGISFQNPFTQLSQVADTVFEEVAFGPLNLGLDRMEVADRTALALESLAISDLAARDPRQLSGGQVQLVAICGLLAMRPRHLVLDEPTAQLDPEGKRLVGDALAALASAGTGLLIGEHDTDLLETLCSRVVALAGGEVALEGETSAVLADPRLPGLGIEPPGHVRLKRGLADAGVDATLPRLTEAAR